MTYRQIAKACHDEGCCPAIYFDEEVTPPMQVRIIDDFGGEIYMSPYQLADLVRQMREIELVSQ